MLIRLWRERKRYNMLYNIYCRPFFQFAFLQLPSRGSPLTLSNIDRILKMKTAAASVAKQGRRNRRGRPPPQVFGRTVNPILPRGQIMPTTVLRAPRIFRLCDGPAKHAISCKNASAAHMLFYEKSLSWIIWISVLRNKNRRIVLCLPRICNDISGLDRTSRGCNHLASRHKE